MDQHDVKHDAYTFKYVYTCDIEDAAFRVKIGNLDGIFPPAVPSVDGVKQQQHSPSKQQHNSATAAAAAAASVQNNYNYNVVEVLDDLSLVDDLFSSDEESQTVNDCLEGSTFSQNKNFSSSNAEFGTKREKYAKLKQKKHHKLNEIIFGGLSQPVRALSAHPFITCDLVSNGLRLCPPLQTQYKQMSKRYEWNEWLLFSLTLDTLPRDTCVCFTVWDTIAPGKMAAVARTSISLFSKHGCLRKGIYDLRLFFNDDLEEYYRQIENDSAQAEKANGSAAAKQNQNSNLDITTADIDFVNRDHRNKDLIVPEADFVLSNRNHPFDAAGEKQDFSDKNSTTLTKLNSSSNVDISQLYFDSITQYMQNDLSLYPNGNCGLSKNVKQLNKLKKKFHNGQIPKVTWLDKLTFLKIEHIIVEEKTLSTLVFLTIEFPIVQLDGVEHCVVYFEDKQEQCCQYDIIEKELAAIPDPEINLENLVELKHHKLARSARSGISDRDLKPTAAFRNQLNAIVNFPSTRPLTNDEEDLVWKFRFYLCNQKKALTKFLKTVKWDVDSEAEQAYNLMYEWAPMDVEDALELLSPHFRHQYVRRYAVSRLKEAHDEDLTLYLLQLVQALKYESFDDILKSCREEFEQYNRAKIEAKCQTVLMSPIVQQSHPTGNLPLEPLSKITSHREHSSRRLFYESPHAPVEAFLSAEENRSSNSLNDSTADSRSVTTNRTKALESSSNTSMPVADNHFALNDKDKGKRYSEDLATFLINRAAANDALANYFYWYLNVECDGVKSSLISTAGNEKHQSIISSAISTSYLVPPPLFSDMDRPVNETKWTRGVSNQAGLSNQEMYSLVLKRFMTKLRHGTPEMVARHRFLVRQHDFVDKLVEIMKEVARENGNRIKKIEKLQELLSSSEMHHRFDFSQSDPLTFPLLPNIKIVGVVAKEASLFKSAMMPAKLAFLTSTGSITQVIFKNGDDLRQDDLVLQMIILMDKLLRMENLDLKLTPYRVLACSSKNGFVQFIDSQSVAEVMSTEGSIQNYLRKISVNSSIKPVRTAAITSTSPSSSLDFQFVSSVKTGKEGYVPGSSSGLTSVGSTSNLTANAISPEIMDAYIKSCAGYCVITYLLGVGDRHLDNLMLTKTGRLFHIDFGFILGRDPKVRPPPMKITREMVDAMGGMNSENFAKFCTLVRTAFLHLRRHANLILNLFSLMVDANVPDIALEPDKTVQKVQDKFKLELNDEQAVHYITEQVEQSVHSIMPVVVDQLHKMTQYLRN